MKMEGNGGVLRLHVIVVIGSRANRPTFSLRAPQLFTPQVIMEKIAPL